MGLQVGVTSKAKGYNLQRAYAGYFFHGMAAPFSAEAAELKTGQERERNAAAMAAIEAAGFVRYPLFATTIHGEPVEKEAWLHPTFEPYSAEGFFDRHGMRYNIYVPSYERAGTAGTMQMLDDFGVSNYYICIDPSQFEKYSQVYPVERLVIRDISFRDENMLDRASSMKLPITMAGHAPLCNFVLALSRSLGESHFWFADDDFKGLAVKSQRNDCTFEKDEEYDRTKYHRVSKLTADLGFDYQRFMRRMEEVMLAVRNPGFVGLEKFGAVYTVPVMWRTGTRVYSYYLTNNESQIAHYARQNNDVVTSMELTKNGLVNLLFQGVRYDSEPTQGGGGQSEMYAVLGTADKANCLIRAQPAYSAMAYKHHRIHHHVTFTNGTPQRVVGVVATDDRQ